MQLKVTCLKIGSLYTICVRNVVKFLKSTKSHLSTCHCLFLRKRNKKNLCFSWQLLETNYHQLKQMLAKTKNPGQYLRIEGNKYNLLNWSLRIPNLHFQDSFKSCKFFYIESDREHIKVSVNTATFCFPLTWLLDIE